ncbi:cytochrome P450 [Pseudomonas sp. PDM09]|uniref:cytochrome P450 n=1 Tax=Pseudomonas sp. PDM09 TaxID=2769270 RepID=UPI001784D81D|nr:cytochrome P450 [Pseudomonas sp. PDM09]MBD9562274.1 cytochrome P450 [Pseudomonas sp. PDM09]
MTSAAQEKPLYRTYPELTDPPANVPPHLVYDVDIFNLPGAKEGPHAAWKQVQQDKPPIFWTPRHGGYWMVTRGEDILKVQNDAVGFSMRAALVPNNPRPFPAPPMEKDPPEHAKWRILISPAFSPRVIQAAEDMVRKFAVDLIEGFKDKGECEFVSEFTSVLPIVVFLTMMDLPLEDRERLLPPANEIARSPDPTKIHHARMALKSYIEDAVSEREKNPRDDLITKILNAKVDGEQIPHDVAVGMLTLLLSGGLDTVKNLMGFCCLSLAQDPALQRRLREDPAVIPHAAEELIRRHGVSMTARLVTQDMDFLGVQLKAGDQIQQFSYLYGLDDATVPNPMKIDFDRPAPIPHATFGNGPHRCPGSILAKKEMLVWLEEWFKRMPEFQVKPGTVPQQDSSMVLVVSELWLSWAAQQKQ